MPENLASIRLSVSGPYHGFMEAWLGWTDAGA